MVKVLKSTAPVSLCTAVMRTIETRSITKAPLKNSNKDKIGLHLMTLCYIKPILQYCDLHKLVFKIEMKKSFETFLA